MRPAILLDTGPLVALLDRRDHYHAWAASQVPRLQSPLLTCEAVLTEAVFLLRSVPRAVASIMDLLTRSAVTVPFRLEVELPAVTRLLVRYTSVPMSLADACLVRMAEQHAASTVFTLDSDFKIYRKNGRQVIPLIIPDDL